MSNHFIKPKLAVGVDLRVLGNREYADIHRATLQLLENSGIYVEDSKALEVFGSSGAGIDPKNKIVKIPAAVVEQAIQTKPAEVTLAGIQPEKDVILKENQSIFTHICSFDCSFIAFSLRTRKTRNGRQPDCLGSGPIRGN